MIQSALAAGITAEGVDVVDAGVIPTPGLAWLAADRGVPAAMVSASHNPFVDNGIKLLGAGGTKLAAELEIAIQDELDQLSASAEAGHAAVHGVAGDLTAPVLGTVRADPDGLWTLRRSPRERRRWGCPSRSRGRDRLRQRRREHCRAGRCSSASVSPTRSSLQSPNGVNINAGCGSTHLQPLQEAVVASGAALGVALDGDADRVLAVDHTGALVDGDQLLAMFAFDLLERGLLAGRSIVVTVMSNLGLRQALAARGIGIVETPVGRPVRQRRNRSQQPAARR